MMTKRCLSLLAVLAMTSALACANGLPGIQPIPLTANPSEQIQGLASEISSAQERDVDVLAPTWFRRANTSLQDARDMLGRGGRSSPSCRASLRDAPRCSKPTRLRR